MVSPAIVQRSDRNEAAAAKRIVSNGDVVSLPARMLVAANRVFCRAYHQIDVLQPARLPRDGAAILVCNHVSGLDPLLIQSVVPRFVTWMMAREYYDVKILTPIFRAGRAIPVDRSGRDLAATRAALRSLQAGQVLGIFPEGKIETSRDLLPFQTGVALMAIKSNVGVYPAYLDGSQRGMEMVPAFAQANRATLTFGPEVKFDRSSTTRENMEVATQAIQAAVLSLSKTLPNRGR